MNELLFILISGLVSFVTEQAKKYVPGINPLFILAILSLFFGGIWVVASRFTGNLAVEISKMWGCAIVVYNLFNEVQKIRDK